MTWYHQLTGFEESPLKTVRKQLEVSGDRLTSHANQRTYRCGRLKIPSLAELRQRVSGLGPISDIVFAITDWSAERRYLGPFRDVFSPNPDAQSVEDKSL